MDPTTRVAGWYPDPTRPGTVRHWDGTQWTAHTAPDPAAEPAGRPEVSHEAPVRAPWEPEPFVQPQAVMPTLTPSTASRRRVPRAVSLSILVLMLALLIGGMVIAFAMLSSLSSGAQDDGSGSAVPIYGDEVDEASDLVASSDAANLRVAVSAAWAESPSGGLPTVASDGDRYLIDGVPAGSFSDGVTLGGVVGSSPDELCVWVVSASGTAYHSGLTTTGVEGTC